MKALHKKLLAVQGGLVKETGRNDTQRYNYLSEEDVLREIDRRMTDAGIVSWVTCLAYETSVYEAPSRDGVRLVRSATVKIKLTLTDAESGEALECEMPGTGEDSGDKAIYKALTGAKKYAYKEAFRLAAGDDPEKPEKFSAPSKPTDKPPAQKPAEKPKDSGLEKRKTEIRQNAKKNGWTKEDWDKVQPITAENIDQVAEMFAAARVLKASDVITEEELPF